MFNWLKRLFAGEPRADVYAVTKEAKEAIRVAHAKRRETPCSNHKVAAPTYTDADVMGMFEQGKFLQRCKRCNWLIPTSDGRSGR